MSEAVIETVSPDRLQLVTDLFNQIFRQSRTMDSFTRRFQGRHNLLLILARHEPTGEPMGFFIGFEMKPTVFYAWFYGVVAEYRRQGVGSQLMETAQIWAAERGYRRIRLECLNSHRPLLHLAVQLGYDVVGLRYDADQKENLVLFEKTLGET